MMKLVVILGAMLSGAYPALAADFPSRPVRIVVPYTPGGAVDIMMRAIGDRLSPALGQPVVVENRPGAGATIGAAAVAKSLPDGHTLLACTVGAMTTNTVLYKNLPYDPLRDFEPVGVLASHAVVLVVNTNLEAGNVAELVALAKRKPGSLSGGSVGGGAPGHVSLAFFNKAAGVDIAHVLYRGSVQITTAVATGELQLAFSDIVPALPLVRSGKMRMLGVIGGQRSSLAPDVPTMGEGGVKGFDFVVWSGLFAPAGTPRDVIARINADIRRSQADPDVLKRVNALGAEMLGGSPEELGARVRREMTMWTSLAREAGAKVD